jgi:hypothetical protein
MVKIIIRGQSQSIPKEEIREAFSFFSDYLLGRRLSKNVYIHVTFVPDLFKLHDEYGYMLCSDIAARYRRKFLVKIDAQLNNYMTIKTIAHELAHVKQYCRGELKDIEGHPKKWQGEIYDETVDYKDLPWEIDALKMEYLLFQPWVEYKRKKYGKGFFD